MRHSSKGKPLFYFILGIFCFHEKWSVVSEKESTLYKMSQASCWKQELYYIIAHHSKLCLGILSVCSAECKMIREKIYFWYVRENKCIFSQCATIVVQKLQQMKKGIKKYFFSNTWNMICIYQIMLLKSENLSLDANLHIKHLWHYLILELQHLIYSHTGLIVFLARKEQSFKLSSSRSQAWQ